MSGMHPIGWFSDLKVTLNHEIADGLFYRWLPGLFSVSLETDEILGIDGQRGHYYWTKLE